jgi:heparanase
MRCAAFLPLAVVLLLLPLPTAPQVTVSFNTTAPLLRLAKPYLNFNIDTGSLYNNIDLRDPVLANLLYPLNNGGVVLRVGGTAADYSLWAPSAVQGDGGNGVTLIGTKTLDDLFYLSAQSHATILFDFNGREGRPGGNGPWSADASNASAILAYLDSAYGGRGGIDWAFSLGNEPEAWAEKVSYTQLGLDALALRAALTNVSVGTAVYGPSCEGLSVDCAYEFLAATRGNVDGVTLHNYPLARHCTVQDYLSTSYVADMGQSLARVAENATASRFRTPLVLEETAGSYGGGCENITDRFLSGFTYMQILGTVA